ncbi:MAG TPA: ABC transporter permease [Solirubrobacterales bacterium]|nr:ABC transporter permease [Solirubrobacterales bacterium]
MAGLIALNLVRNRGRTALTAVGIAIGVATIVALLALSQGLKQSVGGLSHLGGASLGLFQSGVADPTASVLPESLVSQVRAQPGIEDAAPIQLVTDALPDSPSALVFGVRRNSFVERRLVVTAGRAAGAGEAMVGAGFADSEGVGPGDVVTLKGRRFPVSGVFESGVAFEDAGVVVPLAAADELAGRESSVTTIAVVLEPTASADAAKAQLGRAFPGTTTISNPGEAARANPGFEIVTKAVLVIAVLALILGGIAVTNTMAMAVLERRRELALLSAIGWSRPQVAGIVVGEGAGVGLLGAGLGVLGGILISRLIVELLGAADFVKPELTAWGLGRGILVGLAIGILGGLYPAWSVSRRPPAEVLGRF